VPKLNNVLAGETKLRFHQALLKFVYSMPSFIVNEHFTPASDVSVDVLFIPIFPINGNSEFRVDRDLCVYIQCCTYL
jgi:hypothetical protein